MVYALASHFRLRWHAILSCGSDAGAACLLQLGIPCRRRMMENERVAWIEYRVPFTLIDTLWLLLLQRVGDGI